MSIDTHTSSVFSRIEGSPEFEALLGFSPAIEEQYCNNRDRVLLVFQAFRTNVGPDLFSSPLVAESYVLRGLMQPESIAGLVAEARQHWGKPSEHTVNHHTLCPPRRQPA